MIEPAFRQMDAREKGVIRKLLEPEFPGREDLLAQLSTALVRLIDEDGSLEFAIVSERRADHVKYVVPVEAEFEDSDGITAHVLLHMSGNTAKELELFKEDGSTVKSWPEPESLRVFAPQ